jgi:hypothetical protein
MNREEVFENIKALASKERVERRKENEEILRELKEIKELLKEKNNSNNRVITRWKVRVAFLDMDNRIYLQEEKNVIAKTKSEAVEKAKERCEKWSWRKEATIITAEDIIINESEKPNGNN